MMRNANPLLAASFLVFIFLFLTTARAGEITHTGSARIVKDDVRTAIEASKNNALLGGLSQYLRKNLPGHNTEISEEYLMFVNDYTLLDRKLSGGSVVTTVRISINDLILEDVAIYATKKSNSNAVYVVRGLPDYIPQGELRRTVEDIFRQHQFSMDLQRSFEMELIDKASRNDVLSALQAVPSAQYLLEFNFTVKALKAGQSCQVLSDARYTSSRAPEKIIPVLYSEVKVEDSDSAMCILTGVNSSINAALTQLKDKILPPTAAPTPLLQYSIVFDGVSELKSINTILDNLQKRKIILSFSMEEFGGREANFAVKTYLDTEKLATQLSKIQFEEINNISYNSDSVNVYMR